MKKPPRKLYRKLCRTRTRNLYKYSDEVCDKGEGIHAHNRKK